MSNSQEKDTSLIEWRIDKLEQSSEQLIKVANDLSTKVEVLTSKIVIGAGLLTLILNLGVYFGSKAFEKLVFKDSSTNDYYKLESLKKDLEQLDKLIRNRNDNRFNNSRD